MKTIIKFLISLLFSFNIFAAELPNGVHLSAKSVTILDASTNTTIFEARGQEILPIASISKLLIALTIIKQQEDLSPYSRAPSLLF